MANKQQRGRGGGTSLPPRFEPQSQSTPAVPTASPEEEFDDAVREDTTMSAYAMQTQPVSSHARPGEGVTVIGEAVRSVHPETAEFLIEITSSATTVAQALRDIQARTAQVAQAVASSGVHQSDLHTVSMNVYNAWSPLNQNWSNPVNAYGGITSPVAPYAGMPQSLSVGFGMPQQTSVPFMPMVSTQGLQPDIQFGQWTARNTIRVRVNETNRIGEVVDNVSRAGATVLGAFNFRASDESHARRATLESATKDARTKAEALASAAGKQLGDPISVSEDLVTSANGTPQTGQLEFYARVSATFRLQ